MYVMPLSAVACMKFSDERNEMCFAVSRLGLPCCTSYVYFAACFSLLFFVRKDYWFCLFCHLCLISYLGAFSCNLSLGAFFSSEPVFSSYLYQCLTAPLAVCL